MGMDEVPAINRRPTFELSFRDRVDGLDYQLDRVPEGRDQFAEEPVPHVVQSTAAGSSRPPHIVDS